jgi:hypothetical protein
MITKPNVGLSNMNPSTAITGLANSHAANEKKPSATTYYVRNHTWSCHSYDKLIVVFKVPTKKYVFFNKNLSI